MTDYNKFTCSTQDPGLRRDFIGASDAPIIMGDSPWCTPLQLYERKLGLRENQITNPAMQRGIDLEDTARKDLEELFKQEMKPFRMFSARSPWMMANFDAMNEIRSLSAEIKCPLNPDYSDEVPKHYYAQIQHQLYVSRNPEMVYYCYHPLGSKLIWVKEDHDYQKTLVEKEKEFHDRLKNLNPPEPTDRDFIVREDEAWIALTEEYKYLQQMLNDITEQAKECKNQLIYACQNRSCKGNGVTVSISNKKGNIDYQKAMKELFPDNKGVDLEKYRKEGSCFWRVTT